MIRKCQNKFFEQILMIFVFAVNNVPKVNKTVCSCFLFTVWPRWRWRWCCRRGRCRQRCWRGCLRTSTGTSSRGPSRTRSSIRSPEWDKHPILRWLFQKARSLFYEKITCKKPSFFGKSSLKRLVKLRPGLEMGPIHRSCCSPIESQLSCLTPSWLTQTDITSEKK